MAVKVELSKAIVRDMINAAISLRNRHINSETNELIREIKEKEIMELSKAKDTLVEVK